MDLLYESVIRLGFFTANICVFFNIADIRFVAYIVILTICFLYSSSWACYSLRQSLRFFLNLNWLKEEIGEGEIRYAFFVLETFCKT